MSETLRIGLVGAGGNTRAKHIPGFQALDKVDVVVVANRSEASSAKVAKEFGIPRVAADWRAVVDDPAVDAICIGTWPNMHAEVAIAALEAGKHVLTEARMARDLDEATAMALAAHSHPELVAQIVPSPFILRHADVMRGLLGDGGIGGLREIRATHTTATNADSSAPLTWRQDHALSGNNIMSMGIVYEAVQQVLGTADPEWVQADAAIFTAARKDSNGKSVAIEIPEVISILARYANGSRLSMYISGLERACPTSEIRFNGEDGSIVFDFGADVLTVKRGQQGEEIIEPPADARGWAVEADFVDSIRNGTPVRLTSFDDGLRYMRFTQRVWESWSCGGGKILW